MLYVPYTSFRDTASIIAGLDLVISVDTAVVHLAGALGKPVWVLFGDGDVDRRWERSERTGWYDSMTLLHGASWEQCMDRAKERVNAWTL